MNEHAAEAMAHTFVYAGVTSLLIGVVAVAAVVLALLHDLPGQQWLERMLGFPVAVPSVLLAVGFTDLLHYTSHALTVSVSPLALRVGLVWLTAVAYLPWLLSPLLNAARQCDPTLYAAARLSGATPLRAFGFVYAPLLLPTFISSLTLVFAQVTATFAIPYALLTASAQREPLLTLLLNEALGGAEGVAGLWPFIVPLLGIGVVTLLASETARQLARVADGKALAPRSLPAPPTWWAWLGFVLLWAFIGGAGGGALVALLARALVTPEGTWSSLAFISVITDPHVADAVWHSAVLATSAASLMVALATTQAIMQTPASSGKLSRAVSGVGRALSVTLNALPGSVLAVGLLFLAMAEPRVAVLLGPGVQLRLILRDTLWLLLLAYGCKYYAVAQTRLTLARSRLDPALEDAVRTSGGTRWQAASFALLPLLRGAAVQTWVTLFLVVLVELTMTVLLFGPSTSTLGSLVFHWLTYDDPQRAAALSVMLVAFCLCLFRFGEKAR